MPPVEDHEQAQEDDAGSGDGAGAAATVVELRYTVEPNYAGWRLDKYLCQKIRRASRTRVQEIIENDVVFTRKLKASTAVWPGMTFTVRRAVRTEPTVPGPEAISVVYLDEHVLVVDKPAGLPIHPTARYHHNTLVEQLKVRHGQDFKADPAHRLDRETSGLLVCGRTLLANQKLTRAFADGAVDKTYLAIVEGHPPRDDFEVEAAIAEGTPLIRIAVRIDAVAGRAARTGFRVLERFARDGEPFALLHCTPFTGRQHQIRIHAQVAGFPLVGDKMYGPDPGYFDRFSKKALEPEAWLRLRLPRHALHAAKVTFTHPATGERLTFEAPLPSDLEAFRSGAPLADG